MTVGPDVPSPIQNVKGIFVFFHGTFGFEFVRTSFPTILFFFLRKGVVFFQNEAKQHKLLQTSRY